MIELLIACGAVILFLLAIVANLAKQADHECDEKERYRALWQQSEQARFEERSRRGTLTNITLSELRRDIGGDVPQARFDREGGIIGGYHDG